MENSSQIELNVAGGRAAATAASLVWRCFLLVLVGSMVLTQSGCQIFRRPSANTRPVPVQFDRLPSQEQLLASLKSKSSSVRQLNSRVTIAMPGAPKISGTLQVEFPDRMRMKAGVMGASELGVDVGSNAEEFWIWSKAHLPGQPPAFYHANHLAFARSPIRKSIPLEPKWLIEAIGLPDFSPTDVHHGPFATPDGRMKLYTVHQTAGGRQTRVTLLSMGSGLVEQQSMYDSNNRLIAYSNTTGYRNYPEQNLSLPQTIELNVAQPDGQMMEIEVDMGKFSVNSLYGDPRKMWAKPALPGGVRTIDLAAVSNQTQATIPTRLQTSPAGYQRRFQPAVESSGSGRR